MSKKKCLPIPKDSPNRGELFFRKRGVSDSVPLVVECLGVKTVYIKMGFQTTFVYAKVRPEYKNRRCDEKIYPFGNIIGDIKLVSLSMPKHSFAFRIEYNKFRNVYYKVTEVELKEEYAMHVLGQLHFSVKE